MAFDRPPVNETEDSRIDMVTQGDENTHRDGANGVFTRKSVKYIIHNSYVPELKQALADNLGVSPFVFPTGEVATTQETHSIYFDNETLDQYHERVIKSDGAKLVRVRWYGNSLAKSAVFVERKKHHDKEAKALGKESSKKRFELPLARVNPYLRGEWKYEGEGVPGVVASVQKLVVERQLQPKVHTVYSRTSYQSENNKNLRVTLDEGVRCFVENGLWSDVVAADGRPAGQNVSMGFAVMEVKIKKDPHLRLKEHYPEWLLDAIDCDYVQKVKVSKYNFACAALFPTVCYVTPEWLSTVEEFMQTPPTATASQARHYTTTTSRSSNVSRRVVGASNEEASSIAITVPSFGDPDSKKSTPVAVRANSGLHAVHSTDDSISANSHKHRKGFMAVQGWVAGALLNKKKNRGSHDSTDVSESSSSVNISTAKNVSPAPRRVNFARKRDRLDAKALLANERTYFHWVRISAFMATFAIMLVNLQGIGVMEKVTAITIAIDIALIYSTWRFHIRARELARGCSDPATTLFYDRYATTTLSVGLILFFTTYMICLWVEGIEFHYNPLAGMTSSGPIINTP